MISLEIDLLTDLSADDLIARPSGIAVDLSFILLLTPMPGSQNQRNR